MRSRFRLLAPAMLLATVLPAAAQTTTKPQGNAAVSVQGPDRWYMYEEWYDWHPHGDFRKTPDGKLTVSAHFVGPMADTPRGIYVRMPRTADFRSVRLVMNSSDGKPVDARVIPIVAEDCPPDRQWVQIGLGHWVRSFEPLTLEADGEIPPFDYVLLSPNLRYVTHGRAEAWIRDHEAGREIRCGVPLGGVGAGKIELARNGHFRNLTINNNIDAPLYDPPLCFFALHARTPAGAAARALRTDPAMGLPPAHSLAFDGQYPIATLRFSDPSLPVTAKLTAFSPIIPYDVDESSLPVAVFDVELVNPGRVDADVSVALSWENLLGCGGRPQPGRVWGATGHYVRWNEQEGNRQVPFAEPDVRGIRFEGYNKQEKDSEGTYVLIGPVGDGIDYAFLPAYADDDAGRKAWQAFAATGAWPETKPAETPGYAAALAVRTAVPAGRTVHVPLVLAWYTPHHAQMGRVDMGHYYTRRFADALAVARYALANRETLLERTRAPHDLLASCSLPPWIVDALLNDAYVLSTNTWLTRDGRFSVNEGATNMYGTMGTLDQKLYASDYYVLLFPALQRQELLEFADKQSPDGEMPHDLGAGQWNPNPQIFDWPDLTSSFIILSYQYYRLTGDREFWATIRPRVGRAIESLHTVRDPKNQGIPTGGSTFDDEYSLPMMSYHASLYLCDLRIGEAIAREEGNEALARDYDERFNRARATAMKYLYTGRYFRFGADPETGRKSTNSHVSQLAGEVFSHLLGLGDLYERPVARTALASLFALHTGGDYRLPPKLVTSEGKIPPHDPKEHFAPVSWPMHTRAFIVGNAFNFGMAREGMDLWKHMHDAIRDGSGPDPWDQSLYYQPFTARIDWGVFYMTAPATWLAFQSMAGYDYDAVRGRLRLTPRLPDPDAVTTLPVLTPKLWGRLTVGGRDNDLTLEVTRAVDGPVTVREVVVDNPTAATELGLGDRTIHGRVENGVLVLPDPLVLKEGDRLTLRRP